MKQIPKKDKKAKPLFAKENHNDGNRKKKLKPLPKQKYKQQHWEEEE